MSDTLDPITLEVVASGLCATAEEMSEALGRSAYSPIIREMLDYSCALFDPAGNLVAQAENVPSLLGSMGFALRHALERFPAETLRPGDALATNDPYQGGTHTPDLHVFTPIFAGGQLVGLCGNNAHHADMGGPNPGTESFDNRSIFEEGLRLPPVRIATGGQLDDDLCAVLAANVREPRSTLGDLRAQLAACRYGERRVREIADRYGAEVVLAVMRTTLDRAEQRMRAELARLSDFEARAEGWLDDDGVGGPPARIAVAVRIRGDAVEVDFEGTSPQVGGAMNVPPAAAMSGVLFALKCAIDPDAPQNEGCFRPIDVRLPAGSIVNPSFPAAVSLRHLAVQRLADTIMRAFSEQLGERVAAGAFVGFSSLALESRHPLTGELRVVQDDLGGGMGAWLGGDGLDAVDTYLGNVAILPAEVCELNYGLRVRRTELMRDSGGAGQWRGGLGIRREYEILGHEQQGLVYTEQADPRHGAWPLGGHGGGAARIVLRAADGSERELRKDYFTGRPGDRLVIETAGGGGYGDPRRRDRALVEADLREGKVSAEAAVAAYGFR